MIIPSYTEFYYENAVFNGKNYDHFGITSVTAAVYGNKINEIIKTELILATDQSIPPPPQDDPNVGTPDYWGWWDYEHRKFTCIYAKRFLLDMAVNGIVEHERREQGKAYRLLIKVL